MWLDSLDLVTRIRQWLLSSDVTSLEGPSLPSYWRNRVGPGLQMEALNTVNTCTLYSEKQRSSVENVNRVEPKNRLEPVNRLEPGLSPAGGSWQIW